MRRCLQRSPCLPRCSSRLPRCSLPAHDRGSAQPGLSPVVSLPLPPGFPSDGNSHGSGYCHGCFQSPGWMLAATRCDFLLRVLWMAARIIAAFEGYVSDRDPGASPLCSWRCLSWCCRALLEQSQPVKVSRTLGSLRCPSRWIWHLERLSRVTC